jgi:hypothetical protein
MDDRNPSQAVENSRRRYAPLDTLVGVRAPQKSREGNQRKDPTLAHTARMGHPKKQRRRQKQIPPRFAPQDDNRGAKAGGCNIATLVSVGAARNREREIKGKAPPLRAPQGWGTRKSNGDGRSRSLVAALLRMTTEGLRARHGLHMRTGRSAGDTYLLEATAASREMRSCGAVAGACYNF